MSVRVNAIIVSLEIHIILITKIQMMFDDISISIRIISKAIFIRQKCQIHELNLWLSDGSVR